MLKPRGRAAAKGEAKRWESGPAGRRQGNGNAGKTANGKESNEKYKAVHRGTVP